MKIILPKTLVDPNDYLDLPLFFFAGPIRGGGDWQMNMYALLAKIKKDFVVAIPCRYQPDHPLYEQSLLGDESVFKRQLAWEQHYLLEASKSGGIIFWLGAQKEPRDDDQPYAMDTRGELGEWRARKYYEPDTRLFVGGDPEFHGMSQIVRNFKKMLGEDFRVHSDMTSLALAACGFTTPP